jgi:uncharacterized membrane protein
MMKFLAGVCCLFLAACNAPDAGTPAAGPSDPPLSGVAMKSAFLEAKAECRQQAQAGAAAAIDALPADGSAGLDKNLTRKQVVDSIMSSCLAKRGYTKVS